MEEWNDRLQQVHPTRADMNKLVMNYLVTGINNRCGPLVGKIDKDFFFNELFCYEANL